MLPRLPSVAVLMLGILFAGAGRTWSRENEPQMYGGAEAINEEATTVRSDADGIPPSGQKTDKDGAMELLGEAQKQLPDDHGSRDVSEFAPDEANPVPVKSGEISLQSTFTSANIPPMDAAEDIPSSSTFLSVHTMSTWITHSTLQVEESSLPTIFSVNNSTVMWVMPTVSTKAIIATSSTVSVNAVTFGWVFSTVEITDTTPLTDIRSVNISRVSWTMSISADMVHHTTPSVPTLDRWMAAASSVTPVSVARPATVQSESSPEPSPDHTESSSSGSSPDQLTSREEVGPVQTSARPSASSQLSVNTVISPSPSAVHPANTLSESGNPSVLSRRPVFATDEARPSPETSTRDSPRLSRTSDVDEMSRLATSLWMLSPSFHSSSTVESARRGQESSPPTQSTTPLGRYPQVQCSTSCDQAYTTRRPQYGFIPATSRSSLPSTSRSHPYDLGIQDPYSFFQTFTPDLNFGFGTQFGNIRPTAAQPPFNIFPSTRTTVKVPPYASVPESGHLLPTDKTQNKDHKGIDVRTSSSFHPLVAPSSDVTGTVKDGDKTPSLQSSKVVNLRSSFSSTTLVTTTPSPTPLPSMEHEPPGKHTKPTDKQTSHETYPMTAPVEFIPPTIPLPTPKLDPSPSVEVVSSTTMTVSSLVQDDFPVPSSTVPAEVIPLSSSSTLPAVHQNHSSQLPGGLEGDVVVDEIPNHIDQTGWPKGTTVPNVTKPTASPSTPATPRAPQRPSEARPPVYIVLTLGTTWEDFCPLRDNFRKGVAQLLSQRLQRVDPFQVVFLHGHCATSSPPEGNYLPRRDASIEVSIVMTEKDGRYSEELTVLGGKILKSNVGRADLLMKDKVMEVTLLYADERPPVLQEVQTGPSSGVVAAIAIATVAGVTLLVVVVVLVALRHRLVKSSRPCNPTLETHSLESLSITASLRRKRGRRSIRSFLNEGFDDPENLSHILNFDDLTKHASNMATLEEEFKSIPMNMPSLEHAAEGSENKNRYANVIPIPATRVLLTSRSGESGSDYINANYVKGYGGKQKYYIACQAPLPDTVDDFWRMIWEQQSRVVVMLTCLEENGVQRCAPYFSDNTHDCHRLYGDYQVTLHKKDIREPFTISTLRLFELEKNLFREVTHCWLHSWPPTGVPSQTNPVIDFLLEIRPHIRRNAGPTIVHCSPGTGRTGVILALDMCMREMEESHRVDVKRCVFRIRQDRGGAVQTVAQYAFIYKALSEYAARLTNHSPVGSVS